MTVLARLQSFSTWPQNGWRSRGIDFALGALAVLGLAPFYIWGIGLLAFAALAARLHIASRGDNPRKACRSTGFWFGFGYFCFGLFWIGAAFIARGPSYIPLMLPMVLALCAGLALFWAFAGYLYARLSPHGLWAPVIFASIFSMIEILRGHIFSGFPWNLPGYIFKAGGAVSQSASVFGIYGLSFVTLLLAGLMAHSFVKGPRDTGLQDIGKRSGIVFLVLISALFGLGQLRLMTAPPTAFHDGVMLRIVQTPFNQADKLDPQKSVEIVNRYITQTAQPGLADVTHVIWPEGAISGLALENEPLLRAVGDALLVDAPLDEGKRDDKARPIWLVSTLRREERSGLKGQALEDYYNSSAAVVFAADGSAQVMAINDKAKLVPFGEFVPGGKWLEDRGIMPMSNVLASISPAKTKELSRFPGLPKLSPQICYEIIFSGMTPHPKNERAKETQMAQWILNQSNDGWYGKSTGPRQHANQAAYRAIEEGLPIVRAAGNGISGVIGPYGRWLVRAEPDAQQALDVRLPKALKKTVFSVNLIWLLFLINLISCLVYKLRWTNRGGFVLDVSKS